MDSSLDGRDLMQELDFDENTPITVVSAAMRERLAGWQKLVKSVLKAKKFTEWKHLGLAQFSPITKDTQIVELCDFYVLLRATKKTLFITVERAKMTPRYFPGLAKEELHGIEAYIHNITFVNEMIEALPERKKAGWVEFTTKGHVELHVQDCFCLKNGTNIAI